MGNSSTLMTLAAIFVIVGSARADGDLTVVFGKDILTFPGEYKLPSQKVQGWLKSAWGPAEQRREFAGPLNWRGKNNPFRDDVEFGWAGKGPTRLAIRSGGVYAEIAWDNIGFFLKRVESPEHFNILLHVLHKDWPTYAVTKEQFPRILAQVETQGKHLPVKMLQKELDLQSQDRGCFEKDGVWFWNFLLLDDTSIFDYKYAINQKNQIARLRRVLIESPPASGSNTYTGPTTISPIPGSSTPPSAADRPKDHPEYTTHLGTLCRRFLQAAILDVYNRGLLGNVESEASSG